MGENKASKRQGSAHDPLWACSFCQDEDGVRTPFGAIGMGNFVAFMNVVKRSKATCSGTPAGREGKITHGQHELLYIVKVHLSSSKWVPAFAPLQLAAEHLLHPS